MFEWRGRKVMLYAVFIPALPMLLAANAAAAAAL
jgi:hypothetical protein